MTIREANVSDASVMAEIYKYYVDNFSYSFEYTAPTAEDFASRITEILDFFPFFVCEDNGRPSIDPVVLFKIVIIIKAAALCFFVSRDAAA